MYSVLIVDDEIIHCNGLSKAIANIRPSWEIGIAYDGSEAMERFQENNYDILITDIKMPIVDGINLIQQIKSIKPNTICIIQSAYSEFKYAQNALKMGVDDYILKPISKKGIIELINKLEVLMDNVITTSLKSISDNDKINHILKYKTLPENSQIAIVIIKVNFGIIYPNTIQIIRDLFSHHLCSINFLSTDFGEDEIVNIISGNYNINETINIIISIKKILYSDYGLNCNFFVSEYQPYSKRNIFVCYSQAKITEKCNFYYNKDILLFSTVKGRYVKIFKLPNNLENKFINSFIICDRNNSIKLMSEIFQEIIKGKLLCPSIFKEKIKYLFLDVSSNIRDNLWESKNLFLESLYNNIDNSLYIGDLEKLVQIAINELFIVIENTNSNKNSLMIKNILAYITSNLEKDLSLENISNKFSFSPTYFSKLFKDIIGINYFEFLLNQKIVKAKELLETTNMRIYNISLNVGYEDVSYFNRIFKKRTGLSPDKYRKNLKQTLVEK